MTGREDGRAVIEVVLLAVLLLIPTVYILIGVLRLQAATMAVAQAARDVGRLIETSTGLPSAADARQVAEIALADQHVDDTRLTIVTTGPGDDCSQATEAAFSRQPGTDYDLCVIAVITLPGIPAILTGDANTVTGVYSVHIDELREGR